MNILEDDLPSLFGDRGRPAALDPLLDLSEAGIQADRKGVLPGNLHSVILFWIVGGRNLYRGLEPIVGGSEINHRGSAEANVIDIGAGIGDSFQKIFMNLRRRETTVATHKDLVCVKEFRNKITHLIGGVTIEVNVIDSAYVIRVKCTHNVLVI